MKKILFITTLLLAAISGFAQNALNDKADSILGEYLVPDPGNDSKVRFTKNSDGTYKCQIFWLQTPNDPSTGKPWLDFKNPDKSLRSRRTDSIVIIDGLRYDAEKKVWNGTKVYDPNRGIRANVTCKFSPEGKLQLKGTVLGIGETAYWEKLSCLE